MQQTDGRHTSCDCCPLLASAAVAAVKLLKGDLGGRAVPCRTTLAEANSSVKNAASSRPAYAAYMANYTQKTQVASLLRPC